MLIDLREVPRIDMERDALCQLYDCRPIGLLPRHKFTPLTIQNAYTEASKSNGGVLTLGKSADKAERYTPVHRPRTSTAHTLYPREVTGVHKITAWDAIIFALSGFTKLPLSFSQQEDLQLHHPGTKLSAMYRHHKYWCERNL